jgi:hypothetical protein
VSVDSTLDDVRDVDSTRRGRAGRWVAVGGLVLLVALGAAGAFGARSAVVTSSVDGYAVRVEYPAVARAGLDVPWRVTVRHPGGFQGPVTIAVTKGYFEIFETQGFGPEPDGETAGGRYRYLEFSPPPGDTLSVSYDAYIQPSSQIGRRAQVAVLVEGREVGRVRYTTWLVP